MLLGDAAQLLLELAQFVSARTFFVSCEPKLCHQSSPKSILREPSLCWLRLGPETRGCSTWLGSLSDYELSCQSHCTSRWCLVLALKKTTRPPKLPPMNSER